MICPICKGPNQCSERYFNSVCNMCLVNHGTKTEDGRNMKFYNASWSGGILAQIDDEVQVERSEYICFVNNVRCCAIEARFGGVVILPIPVKNKE